MSEDANIPLSTVYAMVHEKNRLATFPHHQWPYMEDCNCTPDKMANAGFYWCGSDQQPDQVRCFVCLKEVEDWDMDDDPREEHKRLCPSCPFVQLGKPQNDLTVKQVMELCQKSLLRVMEIKGRQKADEYSAQAQEVRKMLEQLSEQHHLDE